MDDQQFKISIVTDADLTGFKAAAAESQALSKEMGVINVSQADLAAATKKTTSAIEEGTEKFGESRREIREVGNEIGRAIGVSRAGSLALGGVAAAAFGVGAAIEFLKGTWQGLKDTINGPIEIGLPENAATKISAAAEAWNQYAEARAKVIAAQGSPEAGASAEEKKLENELKLIHEVLAAQKEKALADLELQKGSMSPEALAAARAQIGNIFGEAGTAADQNIRQKEIANKANEAANLEIDAKAKTSQALAIKGASVETVAANEKALDENAAAAEKAKKEIQERIELIKKVSDPDNQGDYAGPLGQMQKRLDAAKFHFRYGDFATAGDALGIEGPRLAQADASILTAQTYRDRESKAAEERKRLMEEAGTESGRAAGLRNEVATDSASLTQKKGVDAYVAGLHRESAAHIATAAGQTTAAVKNFSAVTLNGFLNVHAVLAEQARQIAVQAAQIKNLSGGGRF